MSFLSYLDSQQIIDEICQCNENILLLTYWHATPHLETDYELMLLLLKRNKKVSHLDLSDHLAVNTCTHPGTKSYRDTIGSLLSSFSNYNRINAQSLLSHMPETKYMQPFFSLEDLVAISFRGVNIGPAIKGHVIDQLRTSSPPPDVSLPLANDAYKTCQVAINALIDSDLLRSHDSLIIFNGRYPAAWSASQLFLVNGKNVYFHERGHDAKHFQILNHMPHNYFEWNNAYTQLKHIFPRGLPKSKLSQAHAWINNKIARSDTQAVNFGRDSRRGLLPANFYKSSTVNLSYFTVASDEWSSLPDTIFPRSMWAEDFTSLHALIDIVAQYPSIHLAIRIHPNNATKDAQERDQIHNMHLPSNVTCISASAKIDSYELLEHSHAVFTYGSSIGYESAYLGKPVYIFGRCFYDSLEPFVRIKNYSHLSRVIEELSHQNPAACIQLPPPRADSDYYLYSFCRNQGSLPFTYYTPAGSHSGTFLGVPATYMSLLTG